MLLLLITPIIADVRIKDIFTYLEGTCSQADSPYIEGKDFYGVFDPVVLIVNLVNCGSACLHLDNCTGFGISEDEYCWPWLNNACIDTYSPGWQDSKELSTYSMNSTVRDEWLLERDNMTSFDELMYGAKIGSVDRMHRAHQNGALLNSTDDKNNTALIISCLGGFLDSVTWLLSRGSGSVVNNVDVYGWSALHYAAKYGLDEIGVLLLRNGADPDIKVYDLGTTPLIQVIISSDSAMDTPYNNEIDSYTKLLHQMLLSGADPDIQDNQGFTALHWACCCNHYKKAKYLLEFNSTINLTNDKGSTALDLALSSGNQKVIDLFCSYFFEGCLTCDSNVTACMPEPMGITTLWISLIVILVCLCIIFLIFICFLVHYKNIRSKKLECKTGSAEGTTRLSHVLYGEVEFANQITIEIPESSESVDVDEDYDESQQWQKDLKKLSSFQFKEELTIVKSNIGRGSYGVIHVAHGAEESTFLAVKEYHQMWTEMNVEAKKEFVEEIKTSMYLQHRNVVRCFGFSKKPVVRFVMEYCELGSCIDARDKGLTQQLSDAEKVDILIGACRGLVYLCKKDIIHRDIAARNILLDKNFVPKIADFGRSRMIKNDCSHKTATTVGPLKWMSPESIHSQISNFKSDVWSFGVTMWEIMEDKEPYHDMDPLSACVGVLTGNIRLDVSRINTIYPSLAKLITSCFKDPEFRPSMSDIYSMLQNIMKPQFESEAEVSVVDNFRLINSRSRAISLEVTNRKRPLPQRRTCSSHRFVDHWTTAKLSAPQSTTRENTPDDKNDITIYSNATPINNTAFYFKPST